MIYLTNNNDHPLKIQAGQLGYAKPTCETHIMKKRDSERCDQRMSVVVKLTEKGGHRRLMETASDGGSGGPRRTGIKHGMDDMKE